MSINSLENVLSGPYAVGAEHGSIIVPCIDYGNPGNFGAVCLKEEGEGIYVTLIPLDAYAHDFDVALIKADVENDRIEKSKDFIEACWSLNYRLYWHIVRLYILDNYFSNNEIF